MIPKIMLGIIKF